MSFNGPNMYSNGSLRKYIDSTLIIAVITTAFFAGSAYRDVQQFEAHLRNGDHKSYERELLLLDAKLTRIESLVDRMASDLYIFRHPTE